MNEGNLGGSKPAKGKKKQNKGEKRNTEKDVDAAVGQESTPRSGKRKAKDVKAAQTINKRSASVPQKNALEQLNKLKPGLKYVVESAAGPSHSPLFEVFVNVDGQDFMGRGPSKQSAKQAAAEAALSALGIPVKDKVTDEKKDLKKEIIISSGTLTVKADPIKIIKETHKKPPTALLNELLPRLSYTLLDADARNPSQIIKMSVEVNGKTYVATSQKKKQAKAAVAHAVLCDLYSECYRLYAKSILVQSDDDYKMEDDEEVLALSREITDKMEKMEI